MGAVAAIRDELLEAAARVGEDPGVVFAVGPVEMEFEVELCAPCGWSCSFRGARCASFERMAHAGSLRQRFPPRLVTSSPNDSAPTNGRHQIIQKWTYRPLTSTQPRAQEGAWLGHPSQALLRAA
ncbi:hypothetical protein OG469_38825 [Kitasatospora herbaricolor]|uniref:Trypsin-co-occurring domain-containing protein n=1 Tax=Kitasatospora herbaricolor TaxID=68217 RepID=A0ABZ1WJV9_9ACTN